MARGILTAGRLVTFEQKTANAAGAQVVTAAEWAAVREPAAMRVICIAPATNSTNGVFLGDSAQQTDLVAAGGRLVRHVAYPTSLYYRTVDASDVLDVQVEL